MCTFIVAWQVFPDAPVVVAANRDEALGRASRPPGLYAENPRVVAPRDEVAGGTWIGYNEHGVVASITNRWLDDTERRSADRTTPGGRDRDAERSRGLLVADALERESAEDAARYVERSVDRYGYDGFNFVVLDEDAALLLEWDGRLDVRNLDPGVHVVVNVGADDRFRIPSSRSDAGQRQAESARRALEELQPEPGERSAEWHDRAATTLRDHDYGFCVHGEDFGTRSSSLVRVESDRTASYRFADGPPCRNAYEPITVDVPR